MSQRTPAVRTRRVAAAVLTMAVGWALVSCTSDNEPATSTPVASTSASPNPATTTAAEESPESVPIATTPMPPEPAVVRSVDAAMLGTTWRPECPVQPEDLRLIDLPFVDFDGNIQWGQLVVHEDVVDDVVAVFDELRQMGYPIARMRTVDEYPNAEDELSMADNNTSAFNCRLLPGGTGWSWHAYGRAIDVNPLLNPFIESSGDYEPANAGPYIDRQDRIPGMLFDGDPAVAAFTDRGWTWGGSWQTPIDYQHFELEP